MALASITTRGPSSGYQLNLRPDPNQLISTRIQYSNSKFGAPRTYSLGDSSDEEIPVPTFKCSALTNALLNDAISSADAPMSESKRELSESEQKSSNSNAGSVDLIDRSVSPSNFKTELSQHPKRIVRLSRAPKSSTVYRRSKSVSIINPTQNEIRSIGQSDDQLSLSTPAPVPKRVVRLSASTGKYSNFLGPSPNCSSKGDSIQSQNDEEIEPIEYPSTVSRPILPSSQGSISKYGQSAIGRARHGEDAGVKKVTGAFMNVRPRRGRRRVSDEEQSLAYENFASSNQKPENRELRQAGLENHSSPSFRERQPNHVSHQPQYNSYSPISSNFVQDPGLRFKSVSFHDSRPNSSQSGVPNKAIQPELPQRPLIEAKESRPIVPARQGQENQFRPPSKSESQDPSAVQLERVEKPQMQNHDIFIPNLKLNLLSERLPLAPMSQNTPRRLISSPPKMSILDTATSNAGAATTSNAFGKRNRIKINGKIFTRLDCIGRGGSSRVYRVMAENSKFFALKKVSLRDADESALKGFKGEIDLLKKLEDVERVIRLYDFELNESKGILSVLMELGELDMNKILEIRLRSEYSKFDASFVRHYWREMLECLQAIHAHDVVHSDLKPHNFVLVQGQLKLIDFGIANAIQIEETVNVHRETQIGTPNYMSPESLIDSNAKPDAHGRSQNAPRLMKLGKPSDIWSLGCILYQMTYGRAPFAHIQNQMERCHAIINFSYAIEYPEFGIGNVPVPFSLIRTLKKCLNRDPCMRPSATELLHIKDPFLNPAEPDEREIPMTEELLGRILLNAAAKFRNKIPTDAELLKVWPQGYFDRLRKNKG